MLPVGRPIMVFSESALETSAREEHEKLDKKLLPRFATPAALLRACNITFSTQTSRISAMFVMRHSRNSPNFDVYSHERIKSVLFSSGLLLQVFEVMIHLASEVRAVRYFLFTL